MSLQPISATSAYPLLPSQVGLPDFLQQNTGDFCLSVTFFKDNAISCVCVCLFRSIVTMAVSVAVCEIFSAKEYVA